MRKRLKKKLGLLPPMSRLENIDPVICAYDRRIGAAAYRALLLVTLGSAHGYAAMETTPNGDGTFTHRITVPAARSKSQTAAS